MKRNILVLCFIPFVLIGCVQTSLIDELQIVNTVGFDYISDHTIEANVNIPIYKKDETSTSKTLSAVGRTNREIRAILNTETPKPIHTGKLTSLLFSEELARKLGLNTVLDSLLRDPTVGMRSYIGITSGTTKDLLNTTMENPFEIDLSLYIQKTIDHNEKQHNIPQSNFHRFIKQYYEVGQDPFAPYIIRQGNYIRIDGIALFKGDRFVHNIGLEEAFIMKVLFEPLSNGTYEVPLEKTNEIASIRDVRSKTTYTIDKKTNTPNIDITIDFYGSVTGYTGKDSTDSKITEINRSLKKKLESDAKELIHLFQEKETDPLGIGSRMKSVNRHFNEEEWEDYYPHAKINVTANVLIIGTGIVE